jgi:hypothetical protein
MLMDKNDEEGVNVIILWRGKIKYEEKIK